MTGGRPDIGRTGLLYWVGDDGQIHTRFVPPSRFDRATRNLAPQLHRVHRNKSPFASIAQMETMTSLEIHQIRAEKRKLDAQHARALATEAVAAARAEVRAARKRKPVEVCANPVLAGPGAYVPRSRRRKKKASAWDYLGGFSAIWEYEPPKVVLPPITCTHPRGDHPEDMCPPCFAAYFPLFLAAKKAAGQELHPFTKNLAPLHDQA